MIYISSLSSLMIWRVFFSACLRGIIIWCPHPSHCSLKSIPILNTFQIALPHGCFFFNFNLSPTLISIKILISALLFVYMKLCAKQHANTKYGVNSYLLQHLPQYQLYYMFFKHGIPLQDAHDSLKSLFSLRSNANRR